MDKYTATELAFKNGYEKGKPKWIPVSERLPEKWGSAIVYRKGEQYSMLRHTPALGWHFYVSEWGDVTVDDVTHWMSLPEPPEAEPSKITEQTLNALNRMGEAVHG